MYLKYIRIYIPIGKSWIKYVKKCIFGNLFWTDPFSLRGVHSKNRFDRFEAQLFCFIISKYLNIFVQGKYLQ